MGKGYELNTYPLRGFISYTVNRNPYEHIKVI